MASERLTSSDRERIVKSIAKPLEKELHQLVEEFGRNVIDPVLLKSIPQKVRDFRKEYPKLIFRKEYCYLTDLNPNMKDSRYLHIPMKNFILGYFEEKEVFKHLRSLQSTTDFINQVKEIDKKINSIQGRTRCVLENINTTKQLRDQFPEAYAILMNVSKQEVQDNSCDSIENLRAELSKYNK